MIHNETLRLVKSNMDLCATSPIPDGFVLTGTYPTSVCSGQAVNHVVTPYSGIVVCGYSPVPNG